MSDAVVEVIGAWEARGVSCLSGSASITRVYGFSFYTSPHLHLLVSRHQPVEVDWHELEELKSLAHPRLGEFDMY